MTTQWRPAFKGVSGLDYNVLFTLLDLYDIKDKETVFDGVRIMELAVLTHMNEEK